MAAAIRARFAPLTRLLLLPLPLRALRALCTQVTRISRKAEGTVTAGELPGVYTSQAEAMLLRLFPSWPAQASDPSGGVPQARSAAAFRPPPAWALLGEPLCSARAGRQSASPDGHA